MSDYNAFMSDSAAEGFEPKLPPWFEDEAATDEISNGGSLPEKHLDALIDIAFTKISESFDNYQQRKDQVEMSKFILKKLYLQQTSIVEAGTGIGKSFAYLVAAVAYSYLSGERVVVSTETKNLQMQLVKKDLPAIHSLLDPGLNYQLCLGSGNYLCRLRYEDAIDNGRFQNLIEEKELDGFKSWVDLVFSSSIHGSQFELVEPVGWQFWSLVNRDSDGCPGNKCTQ